MVRIVLPSTKESTDTSRPVINSSMTIVLPALPNFLSSMISLTPASASSSVLQIRTPFPSARPSALRTIGNFACVCKYSNAFCGSSKFSYPAVGIPYFFIRSFENALEPSRIAAFLRGPNTFSPRASKTSTTPPTSGSSIPIIVRSTSCSPAKSASFSNSIAPIGTHSAYSEIPAFPGAQ